jgi:hypothetical protein
VTQSATGTMGLYAMTEGSVGLPTYLPTMQTCSSGGMWSSVGTKRPRIGDRPPHPAGVVDVCKQGMARAIGTIQISEIVVYCISIQ